MPGRRAAFPPSGRSGRIDGDVGLQLALDRGDVDTQVVEDASGAAAVIQCQHREQVFGTQFRRHVAVGVGRGVVRGGVQCADHLVRQRRDPLAGHLGGRTEQPARRGADRLGAHAEAVEDGRGDTVGE